MQMYIMVGFSDTSQCSSAYWEVYENMVCQGRSGKSPVCVQHRSLILTPLIAFGMNWNTDSDTPALLTRPQTSVPDLIIVLVAEWGNSHNHPSIFSIRTEVIITTNGGLNLERDVHQALYYSKASTHFTLIYTVSINC